MNGSAIGAPPAESAGSEAPWDGARICGIVAVLAFPPAHDLPWPCIFCFTAPELAGTAWSNDTSEWFPRVGAEAFPTGPGPGDEDDDDDTDGSVGNIDPEDDEGYGDDEEDDDEEDTLWAAAGPSSSPPKRA